MKKKKKKRITYDTNNPTMNRRFNEFFTDYMSLAKQKKREKEFEEVMCEISDLAAKRQLKWTKDAFAAGYQCGLRTFLEGNRS